MNITKEVKLASTNQQTAIKESKMKITGLKMIRVAGLAAMGAGILYITIQAIHPLDVLSSVTTAQWAITHYLSIVIDLLAMLGVTGIFARQVEKSGWLGLTGFLLLSVWFVLITGFSFVEAFILPHLAAESPAFVESLLGMLTGVPSTVDLGVLPMLWNISGPMYILGALLFGIATFRARVLLRWAGGLLTLAAVLIPIGGMFPHDYQAKIAMIPVGLAMVWLGYALFSERRERSSEVVSGKVGSQLSQTEAK